MRRTERGVEGDPFRLIQVSPGRKNAAGLRAILSSAIEQTGDNVFVTDREGIIQYVNLAFERSTGYQSGEAVGKTRVFCGPVNTIRNSTSA